ncbi:MAG TPA: CehA/McbA family metallohydrolase [Chthonomonadaceae bacterium]|nr:CehA/McbA family metallohydrolase [Chthonomonadaceae bacterium]
MIPRKLLPVLMLSITALMAPVMSPALPVQKAQAAAPPLPTVTGVAAQPLAAQVNRLVQALDYLGSPLPEKTRAALRRAVAETDDARLVQAVQAALDPYCLLMVDINPESRVKVMQGPARPELVEQGWRQFLVKVHNAAGVTAELRAVSPNALPLHGSPPAEVRNRWLDMQMFDGQPLAKTLSGLELEYRVIQLYSRDSGRREAQIGFNVGQGTQDIGFRNAADILFRCLPASEVTLRVRDENGQPTTAMFTIRDRQGRVYPSQAKRLAPDFAFQPQVYRADGEKLKLPRGMYTVEYTRGPEYLVKTQTVALNGKPQTLTFNLERWVDPSKLGWWSGDHHIHAAGCAHYANPTQGVYPLDMIRHCQGEDLKVGCNLTWGPCFDFQKQFFTGQVDKVSQYPYLLRYDIEVSGFGSHQSGHLVLLRLKQEIYPGGDSDKHWPTLCLNTLRWAKRQGAVCGPAHSAFGLEVPPDSPLPNYIVPPYNGIGANEYIVDVTHQVPGPDGKPVPAVDFMSTVDTPYLYELNMWYHTLNCGYRTRISGETDFPCISGERVGMGRSYVKLDGKLDFDSWCEGIRNGRCYVSDGRSHLMEFTVNGLGVGEKGSELRLAQPASVHLTAKVAALLPEKPDTSVDAAREKNNPWAWPYWHLERARIGQTREVPVEVVVNGYPVAHKNLVADGKIQDIAFDVPIKRSSWVALRILGSSHTNPVFVLIGDKPIRASRRSAEWCLKGVDQCWSQKQKFIKPEEMDDARKAYDHARDTYRQILSECDAD